MSCALRNYYALSVSSENMITEVGLCTMKFKISFKMHANKFKTKNFNNKGKKTST